MAFDEKKNQNLMQLVKKVHGLVENQDIEKQRQSQEQIGSLLKSNKEITYKELAGEDGLTGEWVSVNRPHTKKYVILYCHGGGYSTGSSLYARTITAKLAGCTSMDVLSFDYRLAPEHPYPAAITDAMRAWDSLMLLGYGARDVIVAGDSAGGNLALALTLKLKEEGRLLPRGLVLFSPWTDLTASGKSYQTKAALDPVLDMEYLQRAIADYAGKEDLQNPYISPLFGDFTGFPPVYIQVGDNEILLSDSESLYKKMLKADVAVKMEHFKGMWHVFQMTPVKKAYEAMDMAAEFIYDICR